MNFICEPCRVAADIVAPKGSMMVMVKKGAHDRCKGGTQCDCQHKVGRNAK